MIAALQGPAFSRRSCAVPVTPCLQELALSAKPGLLAAIEELEKMTGGLKDALKEELTAAVDEARHAALAEAEEGEEWPLPSTAAASGGSGSPNETVAKTMHCAARRTASLVLLTVRALRNVQRPLRHPYRPVDTS